MADRLSRKAGEWEEGDKVLQISRSYWSEFQEIMEEVENDESLKIFLEEIKGRS